MAALGQSAANLDKKAHASTLHGVAKLHLSWEEDNSGKFPHQDLFSLIPVDHHFNQDRQHQDQIRWGTATPIGYRLLSSIVLLSSSAFKLHLINSNLYGDNLLSTEYLVPYSTEVVNNLVYVRATPYAVSVQYGKDMYCTYTVLTVLYSTCKNTVNGLVRAHQICEAPNLRSPSYAVAGIIESHRVPQKSCCAPCFYCTVRSTSVRYLSYPRVVPIEKCDFL